VLLAVLGMVFVTDRSIAVDYVLLTNGNVIQGRTSVIGDHVVIDRGDGNELRLNSRQVMHSAPTLTELYRYRQKQRQYPHLASYQDDARWCYRHQMYDEMRVALDSADALDPSHPETLRLRRQLASIASRTSVDESLNVDLDAFHSSPAPGRAVVIVAQPKANPPAAEELVDAGLNKANLSYQAVSYFSSRIQPLLINRCGNAGCHRAPSDNLWQLTHMGSHIRPPSRMTKLNLLATLSLVDRTNGQQSDLLRYATKAHGGKGEAPLKRGDDSAIESLTEWINEVSQNEASEDVITVADIPIVADDDANVAAGNSRSHASQSTSAPVRQVAYVAGEVPLAFDDIATKTTMPSPSLAAESKVSRNRPKRLPTVENPFDPEIFNRYYREGAIANSRDR
jgi:hypothetical protein